MLTHSLTPALAVALSEPREEDCTNCITREGGKREPKKGQTCQCILAKRMLTSLAIVTPGRTAKTPGEEKKERRKTAQAIHCHGQVEEMKMAEREGKGQVAPCSGEEKRINALFALARLFKKVLLNIRFYLIK